MEESDMDQVDHELLDGIRLDPFNFDQRSDGSYASASSGIGSINHLPTFDTFYRLNSTPLPSTSQSSMPSTSTMSRTQLKLNLERMRAAEEAEFENKQSHSYCEQKSVGIPLLRVKPNTPTSTSATRGVQYIPDVNLLESPTEYHYNEMQRQWAQIQNNTPPSRSGNEFDSNMAAFSAPPTTGHYNYTGGFNACGVASSEPLNSFQPFTTLNRQERDPLRRKPKDQSAQNLSPQERRRLDCHNEVERRRRFTINDGINKLWKMLPENQDTRHRTELVGPPRVSKGDILKGTVVQVERLKYENQQLKNKERQLNEERRKLREKIMEYEQLLFKNQFGIQESDLVEFGHSGHLSPFSYVAQNGAPTTPLLLGGNDELLYSGVMEGLTNPDPVMLNHFPPTQNTLDF